MQRIKKAFTLIELLIVIAIIAILTVAFLPNALKAPARARDAGKIKTVQDIAAALEGYYNSRSSVYPAPDPSGCVTAGLATTLGMSFPASVDTSNVINSCTYHYWANVTAPQPSTFYAIGFVPENTASANSSVLVGRFVNPGGTATNITAAQSTPIFTTSGTAMYVAKGPM